MRSLFRFKHHNISTTHPFSKANLGFVIRNIVTSCRAVLLPRFGGADVLELRDNVRLPDLKPNDVLVRTRAVSVNPLDTRVSCDVFCCLLVLFRCLFIYKNLYN